MLHIALHFVVPLCVALGFYRRQWRKTALILFATMLVDLDHLLATPIYDPDRCSIGFHPLHGLPAILFYVCLFAVPLLKDRNSLERSSTLGSWLHVIGLGLLIHMTLDWSDC